MRPASPTIAAAGCAQAGYSFPPHTVLRAAISMQKYIPLILAVVTTNAISQLLLKHGMNTIGRFDFGGGSLMRMLPIVALNPFVIAGLLVLVFSMGLHLMALSRVDISFAYPFLSISYVMVLLAGYFLFNETSISPVCLVFAHMLRHVLRGQELTSDEARHLRRRRLRRPPHGDTVARLWRPRIDLRYPAIQAAPIRARGLSACRSNLAESVASVPIEPDDVIYNLAARMLHPIVPRKHRYEYFYSVDYHGAVHIMERMERARLYSSGAIQHRHGLRAAADAATGRSRSSSTTYR